jgi:thiamine kinase-like enzyme
VDDLRVILDRLEPELGVLDGEPEVLSGGITNRNLRARLGGNDYVLRLCGKDTEVLSIDRETEVAATRAASAAGVAPEVVRWLPELQVLVTAFVPGRPMEASELRDPATLAVVAAALRRIHDGPPLATTFPTFTLAREYAAVAAARGGEVPADDHALALELSDRIGAALRDRPGHEPVPCHNDLLCANVLRDGERLALLDWEYAGMNDRFFDLGNLAVNNGLDEHDEEVLLEAYFGEPATPARIASLRLMRLMSDVREAMWGVVQEAISSLDFDYRGYAGEHFARLRAGAADPRLQEWISAASP